MDEQLKAFENTQYFHGTKVKLAVGDLLQPGFKSNFKDITLKHIYFTGTLEAAKWGAELATAKGEEDQERIYIVTPLGDFEDDPNVTDQKFPGNPTRSYRSTAPLKIVAELADWERHSDEEINKMLAGLEALRAAGKDVIID